MGDNTQRDKYGGTEGAAVRGHRLLPAGEGGSVVARHAGGQCLSFPSASTTSNLIAPPLPTTRNFGQDAFGVPVDSETPAFYPGVLEKAKTDVALLGMNTLGCHTPHFYGESFMPYVAQVRCVDICHYMVPDEGGLSRCLLRRTS